jgi:hypothetical protein
MARVSAITAPLDVIGGEAARTQRRDRGDVDDGAPTRGLDHRGDRVARGQVHRLHIDLHEPAPGRWIRLEHAATRVDPDIVVEKIELPETLHGRGDHRLGLNLLGNIGGKGRGIAALLRDHRDRALGELDLAIHHQDAGAGARQQDRRRAPIADAVTRGAAAGHDGDLPGEARLVVGFCAIAHALTSR